MFSNILSKKLGNEIFFTPRHGLFSNVLLGVMCFFASLRIALACTLDVFISPSGQFKSGMRCIRAGLLLCQEDNPLMTDGQHFHPRESDLSEAEVALSLHKIILGTNKNLAWGVLIACSRSFPLLMWALQTEQLFKAVFSSKNIWS